MKPPPPRQIKLTCKPLVSVTLTTLLFCSGCLAANNTRECPGDSPLRANQDITITTGSRSFMAEVEAADGLWYSVCTRDVTAHTADVICKSLGFAYFQGYDDTSGGRVDDFWSSDPKYQTSAMCQGWESCLSECPDHRWEMVPLHGSTPSSIDDCYHQPVRNILCATNSGDTASTGESPEPFTVADELEQSSLENMEATTVKLEQIADLDVVLPRAMSESDAPEISLNFEENDKHSELVDQEELYERSRDTDDDDTTSEDELTEAIEDKVGGSMPDGSPQVDFDYDDWEHYGENPQYIYEYYNYDDSGVDNGDNNLLNWLHQADDAEQLTSVAGVFTTTSSQTDNQHIVTTTVKVTNIDAVSEEDMQVTTPHMQSITSNDLNGNDITLSTLLSKGRSTTPEENEITMQADDSELGSVTTEESVGAGARSVLQTVPDKTVVQKHHHTSSGLPSTPEGQDTTPAVHAPNTIELLLDLSVNVTQGTHPESFHSPTVVSSDGDTGNVLTQSNSATARASTMDQSADSITAVPQVNNVATSVSLKGQRSDILEHYTSESVADNEKLSTAYSVQEDVTVSTETVNSPTTAPKIDISMHHPSNSQSPNTFEHSDGFADVSRASVDLGIKMNEDMSTKVGPTMPMHIQLDETTHKIDYDYSFDDEPRAESATTTGPSGETSQQRMTSERVPVDFNIGSTVPTSLDTIGVSAAYIANASPPTPAIRQTGNIRGESQLLLSDYASTTSTDNRNEYNQTSTTSTDNRNEYKQTSTTSTDNRNEYNQTSSAIINDRSELTDNHTTLESSSDTMTTNGMSFSPEIGTGASHLEETTNFVTTSDEEKVEDMLPSSTSVNLNHDVSENMQTSGRYKTVTELSADPSATTEKGRNTETYTYTYMGTLTTLVDQDIQTDGLTDTDIALDMDIMTHPDEQDATTSVLIDDGLIDDDLIDDGLTTESFSTSRKPLITDPNTAPAILTETTEHISNHTTDRDPFDAVKFNEDSTTIIATQLLFDNDAPETTHIPATSTIHLSAGETTAIDSTTANFEDYPTMQKSAADLLPDFGMNEPATKRLTITTTTHVIDTTTEFERETEPDPTASVDIEPDTTMSPSLTEVTTAARGQVFGEWDIDDYQYYEYFPEDTGNTWDLGGKDDVIDEVENEGRTSVAAHQTSGSEITLVPVVDKNNAPELESELTTAMEDVISTPTADLSTAPGCFDTLEVDGATNITLPDPASDVTCRWIFVAPDEHHIVVSFIGFDSWRYSDWSLTEADSKQGSVLDVIPIFDGVWILVAPVSRVQLAYRPRDRRHRDDGYIQVEARSAHDPSTQPMVAGKSSLSLSWTVKLSVIISVLVAAIIVLLLIFFIKYVRPRRRVRDTGTQSPRDQPDGPINDGETKPRDPMKVEVSRIGNQPSADTSSDGAAGTDSRETSFGHRDSRTEPKAWNGHNTKSVSMATRCTTEPDEIPWFRIRSSKISPIPDNESLDDRRSGQSITDDVTTASDDVERKPQRTSTALSGFCVSGPLETRVRTSLDTESMSSVCGSLDSGLNSSQTTLHSPVSHVNEPPDQECIDSMFSSRDSLDFDASTDEIPSASIHRITKVRPFSANVPKASVPAQAGSSKTRAKSAPRYRDHVTKFKVENEVHAPIPEQLTEKSCSSLLGPPATAQTDYDMFSTETNKIPPDYKCSLTNKVMKCPVIAQDGRTYDKKPFLEWVKAEGTSPKSEQPLHEIQLKVDLVLMTKIKEWQRHRKRQNMQSAAR